MAAGGTQRANAFVTLALSEEEAAHLRAQARALDMSEEALAGALLRLALERAADAALDGTDFSGPRSPSGGVPRH